jgi:hypothetical protein
MAAAAVVEIEGRAALLRRIRRDRPVRSRESAGIDFRYSAIACRSASVR